MALVGLIAACGQRGSITVDPAAEGVGVTRSIFIGTTRAFDPAIGSFGNQRSNSTAFARYDISIPPDRDVGQITWPGRGQPPDPRTDFLTTDRQIFDGTGDFRAGLGRALRQSRAGDREVVIFVHGFNNTFAEGLYRIAQLEYDLKLPGETVHYSWPSAAQPLGYIRDSDSALFARDGLEKLFNEVIEAGANRIILVGHSMGAKVLVETMRQMSIRDGARMRRYIGGVVLLSPDLDIDVFRSQTATIGQLPQPFFIFSSQRDKALRLSALLTGQPDRLGNIVNLDEVADLDVQVIDVTNFSSGTGHFTVGDSPALIQLIGSVGAVQTALDADKAGRPGLLPGIALTATRATALVVAPVVEIGQELER